MEELRFDFRGERDGFDAYYALYCSGTDVTRTGRDFGARVIARRYSRLLVFDRTLSDVAHERTARRIRSDSFEHATVQFVLSGRLGVGVEETRRWVRPGELVIFDMRQPQRTWIEGVRHITVSLPCDLLAEAALETADFHGRIVGGDEASVIGSQIRFLANCATPPDPVVADAVISSLVQMLGAVLGDARSRAEVASSTRVRKAMRFIRQSIERSDLSPEVIAEEIGISRSALYRTLERQGGVFRAIKRQRLLAMRKALALPADTRPIATIARDCGFVSDAHANRSFRDEFGIPPGEYRIACSRRTRDVDQGLRFLHWFEDF